MLFIPGAKIVRIQPYSGGKLGLGCVYTVKEHSGYHQLELEEVEGNNWWEEKFRPATTDEISGAIIYEIY